MSMSTSHEAQAVAVWGTDTVRCVDDDGVTKAWHHRANTCRGEHEVVPLAWCPTCRVHVVVSHPPPPYSVVHNTETGEHREWGHRALSSQVVTPTA